MKRALILFLALAFLAAPVYAADKVEPIWTAQATNTAKTIQTAGYGEAQVVVWAASGTPNGTVSIYDATPGAPLVLLATYATPTTAKKFRGPAGTTLVVALSGNSTGTVGAVAVLK